MYKKTAYHIGFLIMALCLLNASQCLAQDRTILSLNNEEVNLRSGISIENYQQQEKVSLKLESLDGRESPAFEEIRIYLARGSRPMQMQKYARPEGDLTITSLLRQAKAGDRLVIEFFGHENDESGKKSGQVVTLALN